ncbi:precorrin-3B synthase [Streptomyces sp. NBC_01187]|uniref:precorrin-3B synthase n=1 Tax=Streptomyces sp. NBC_01187 TaxID=2903766 RepID=UPI0038704AFD
MPVGAPRRSVGGSSAARTSRSSGDACPGALRLHQADDGALARVRLPGGVLSAEQAEVLAECAVGLGDGGLHLTSRGNVQLRGLPADCGAELAELLGAAGLLPSPAHERVRNIVASPLSGLDGHGSADVRPWLTELDQLLCTSEAAQELSGRFLFALDDGRGDVAALGADVTLLAVGSGEALLVVGGAALRMDASNGARAALIAAEVFLETARECGVRAWRVAELLAEGPVEAAEPARRVARRVPGTRVAAVPSLGPAGEGPAPGLVPYPGRRRRGQDGTQGPEGAVALSVLAPLGLLSAAQWRLLADTARREGAGELRLTPWRGVVVPGVRPENAAAALAALAAAGLVTGPGSPWRGVGACTGRPGCARSLADVRKDAASTLGTGGGLPVYWSGCARRCGRPPGAHVDVVADEDGYRVSVVGAGDVPPGRASTIASSELTEGLTEGLTGELADIVATARASGGDTETTAT